MHKKLYRQKVQHFLRKTEDYSSSFCHVISLCIYFLDQPVPLSPALVSSFIAVAADSQRKLNLKLLYISYNICREISTFIAAYLCLVNNGDMQIYMHSLAFLSFFTHFFWSVVLHSLTQFLGKEYPSLYALVLYFLSPKNVWLLWIGCSC